MLVLLSFEDCLRELFGVPQLGDGILDGLINVDFLNYVCMS